MDLYTLIMNMQATGNSAGDSMAYKLGHRDARHAAAERAMLGDACVEALRSALLVMKGEALPLKRNAIQQAEDALSALDNAIIRKAAPILLPNS